MKMVFLLLWMGCSGKASDTADSQTANQGQSTSIGPLRRVAVAETASGKVVITDGMEGRVSGEICLSELHPDICDNRDQLINPCLMFGTHIQTDGSVLITYTLRDPDSHLTPGMISLVSPTHPPTVVWTIESLAIPNALQTQEGIHCIHDPLTPGCTLNGTHTSWLVEDDVMVVSDTNNHRILWLRIPTEGAAPVKQILSSSHPQWGDERNPNQVQRIEIDQEPHVLITFKSRINEAGETIDEGTIVLWNIKNLDSPKRVWTYPSQGSLAAVHQGWVQDTPTGELLLYAHSAGGKTATDPNQYGSIGFASFNGKEPPEYIADGILAKNGLGFTRDVEWDPHSKALLVVDSGCENLQDRCGRDGRILSLKMPNFEIFELGEHGKTGQFLEDNTQQEFIGLQLNHALVRRTLRFPFEVDPLTSEDWTNVGICE